MFRSATFKLTMWYLAIVMAISLAFSVVLYHVATNELQRGFHRQTDRIYRQFPIFEGSPLLKPGIDYSNSSHEILARLVAFNVLVLFAAGFSSYWLARRTLEPIEEAHEQQKRFTADVSHELRTPLTALKMESEVALMNRKASAKDLRGTIKSNLEEVVKLESLVNNLLRLAQLEASEVRQHFRSLSARTVAEDAIKQVQPAATERSITLKSELHDLPLYGDEGSLTQLIAILLDNAVKYSPSGSTVSLKTAASGEKTVITVEDHGKGISPEALEHVFDRFYRADKSRTKSDIESSGYGLGLSIAKMIADVHGGSIHVSSRVGKGTTATISVPVTAPEAKTTEP